MAAADVTSAEQARIAEEAGAVAVMALERIPADIRKGGGVARMSDPAVRACAGSAAAQASHLGPRAAAAQLVKQIKAAVTIPVMAKCRIGHIAEARILEALEVDYAGACRLTPGSPAPCQRQRRPRQTRARCSPPRTRSTT